MREPIQQTTNPPNRFLRLAEVQTRTGLARSTIYVRLDQGRFPRPVSLGARAVGWIEAEVDEWIRERIAESRGDTDGAAHWLLREGTNATSLEDGARAGVQGPQSGRGRVQAHGPVRAPPPTHGRLGELSGPASVETRRLTDVLIRRARNGVLAEPVFVVLWLSPRELHRQLRGNAHAGGQQSPGACVSGLRRGTLGRD